MQRHQGPARAAAGALAARGRGVEGGLAAVAYAEHLLGRRRRPAARRPRFPADHTLWRLAAHASLRGRSPAGRRPSGQRAMRGIEAGAAAEEPVFGGDEGDPVDRPDPERRPGQPGAVGHARAGRAAATCSPTCARPPLPDRPAGLPDLSIETVMGEPALAAPVQVYVGLDSAPTVRERVDLALAEMERTGAFDRSLLVLVSPTGLGYVNYVALAAAQYLTRGDVASVTMQYSKPALAAVAGQGRGGPRAEPAAVAAHPRAAAATARAAARGWSCSARAWARTPARTSSCTGARWACEALGIDRALWIGTPYGSEWMHEVTGPDRLDVDRDSVAVVNDFASSSTARAGAAVPAAATCMLSHDNDGVTKFGPDLLTTAPAWLGPHRPTRRARRPAPARAASRSTCAGGR